VDERNPLGLVNPGLYVHIPFCSAICPYCDFAVLTGGPEKRRRFTDHLVREISMWTDERSTFESIDTIYFGGGTPSALALEDLARILAAARENLSIQNDACVFFEANPEDVTPESVQAWRNLGVRFLSLGIQSFDADALKFLGRRHSPEQALRSFEIARAAGFETISIDLIYGLPDQPFEIWKRTLEQAVALQPDHLSCYQLTIHEGTPFGFRLARGKMTETPEETQGELFLFTHSFLKDAGSPTSPGLRSTARGTTKNTGTTCPISASALRPTPSRVRAAGGTSGS
jgi:oxygen-independent coproporphyrinogen-3 oxidase